MDDLDLKALEDEIMNMEGDVGKQSGNDPKPNTNGIQLSNK